MSERRVYRRVADELKTQIATGRLRAGEMVPSELSLAREFSVARGTARAALVLLEAEGLVEVVPGLGRRVVGMTEGARMPTTAYASVAAALRADIAAGAFDEDTPLPSEAQLMTKFGVSRNTVRRAYAALVEERLVVVRHGAGAFVAPSARDT